MSIFSKGCQESVKSYIFAKICNVPRALVLPRRAIVQRGQIEGVFVLHGSPERIAHLRLVKTGQSQGDRVETLSGLSAGERVVVQGSKRLSEGNRVEEGA